jgi:hypothetical protein
MEGYNLNACSMEIKFKEGDEVYDRIRPGQKLIISRYFQGIYYCKIEENLRRKELIYLERELMIRKSA